MLDFSNKTKPTLTIKLDENTTLEIVPASKKIVSAMEIINKDIKSVGEESAADLLYDIVAKLLSCNKQNKQITVSDVEHLEISDISLIFAECTKMITGIANDPN